MRRTARFAHREITQRPALCRPKMESLEERLPPGDAVMGQLIAMSLATPGLFRIDQALVAPQASTGGRVYGDLRSSGPASEEAARLQEAAHREFVARPVHVTAGENSGVALGQLDLFAGWSDLGDLANTPVRSPARAPASGLDGPANPKPVDAAGVSGGARPTAAPQENTPVPLSEMIAAFSP